MTLKTLIAMATMMLPVVLAVPAHAADPMAAEKMAPAMDMAKGKMLLNDKGMTLYTFDQDMGGKSSCTGMCAQNWPPMMAPAGSMAHGDWTVVARDDGGMQWAYKGKPLYTFAKDMKPGDAMGDGLKGMWHTAMK